MKIFWKHMLSGCFHLFIQWAFFVKHSLIYAKYKRILLRDPLQSWVFFLIQSNLKRCSNNVSIFLVCKWRWQRLFCDLNALCALLHLYRVQRTFFGSVCPLGVQDWIWRPLYTTNNILTASAVVCIIQKTKLHHGRHADKPIQIKLSKCGKKYVRVCEIEERMSKKWSVCATYKYETLAYASG